jgi:Leucine-rich repeat (LRR) protein
MDCRMPDTQSRPAASRKLGGIPQGETTSPSIYRKPPAFKMRPIPRPPERVQVKAAHRSQRFIYTSLLLAFLVLGGSYVFYQYPPALTVLRQQFIALRQPQPASPTPVVGGATPPDSAPADSTPLADASQGWTWLFDEGEWRVPSDARREYREGLLRLRSSMEKPQPAADATIRARIVIREGLGSPGVFLRSTAEGGRYRLFIDPDMRFVRLVHQSPAGTHELGKHRFFKSLVRGDRLLLELRAQGERLAGSVNGERVIEADDARSKEAGSWGIESADAWFELVEVPIPPLKTIAETTPPLPAEPAAPMPAAPKMAEVAPAPVPVTPISETGKWLASMEPQWQASYEREVAAPYERGVSDLKKQLLGTIEAQLTSATQARKLDDAAFFRGERQRLAAGEDVPMTDELIVPPALKSLRNGYRTELARLDKERADRAKAFHARTDSLLGQSQVALAQRQRYEEAAEIKKKREQLVALWVKPPASVIAPATAAATATPAPLRPPIGSAVAATVFTKMPPQQVVEKLLAIGAGVWVTQKGGANASEVKSLPELNGDKFTITHVEIRREGLDQKSITTADLGVIEALSDVTELGLRGPAVTDVIFEKIKAFRHLGTLTIEGAKITAASYAILPTLPELRDLRLSGLGTSDEGIKTIGQCRKIERLSLANLPISDEALSSVGKLPALQELDLSNLNKLTSTGIAFLVECRSLRRLNLSGFRLSSSVIEAVGRCTGLESLTLSGNPVKDDQIAGLSALNKLHTLNLSNTGLVGTAFANWPPRHAMTTLNLTNQPGVDDAALKAIGSAFPKLETLEISGAPLSATAVGFASVGRLRSLRTLRVGGALVNDEIMAELAKCNDLQTLNIPGGRLTEPGVAALAKLARLNSLELDLPPVTDEALKSFSKCKALKTILIAPDAPEETEKKLRTALSGVTIRKR